VIALKCTNTSGPPSAEPLVEGGQASQGRAGGGQQAERQQHRDDAADTRGFRRDRGGGTAPGNRHQGRSQQVRGGGLGQQLAVAARGHRPNPPAGLQR
jgi:hypothetical protein